jgi:hypothetical protein
LPADGLRVADGQASGKGSRRGSRREREASTVSRRRCLSINDMQTYRPGSDAITIAKREACKNGRALAALVRAGEQVVDLYIRGRQAIALEPRRVVVELSPDEYRALEVVCRGRCITAPELVRLVALRLARAV